MLNAPLDVVSAWIDSRPGGSRVFDRIAWSSGLGTERGSAASDVDQEVAVRVRTNLDSTYYPPFMKRSGGGEAS